MSHPLRDYQLQAEADIFAEWKDGRRSVMFQLVTGAGKTVLFVSIIKKFLRAGKRVVLVAHREELIKQAWDMLYRHEIMAGIIKSGVPENFSLPCQVASIQTICRRSKLPKADLIVFDEAHHTQDDNSYGDVLIRHWPAARVLGVTATPYRLGGKGFTTVFDCLVQGPEFKALTAKGYLTPFKYFVSYNPDLSGVKTRNGDYVVEDAATAMRLAPIVESYLEHCRGMSGICFAVNITHSNEIVRQYLASGIPAAHVDALTPLDHRRKMFQDLRDKKILVLVNVGIATEGTDIPNIDFVQLARPTKSLSLFLQMVGRVTRPLWEAISSAVDDEERAALVAMSAKPNAIILDNAGVYLEHGLPDQSFDWPSYFQGIDRRKAKQVEEVIEIIEFVAEDEDGGRIVSRIPKEVEGLKLIEVNYIAQQKIINLKSLKEFDRYFEMFKRMPKIPKPWFATYRNYADYCRKNHLLMSEEVWDYMLKRMVKDPAQERTRLSGEFERNSQIIRDNHGREEGQRMIQAALQVHENRVAIISRMSAPPSFLMKEKREYFEKNKIPVTA